MDRRTALRNASLVLGYSLTAPAIVGIMNGCKPEVVPGFEPAFFAKEQLGTVKAFMDTIIPKTNTPAASEVGVLEFIDNLMAVVMKPEEKEMVKMGFQKLAEISGGTNFEKQSAEQRTSLLAQMEKEGSEEKVPYNERFWYFMKGLIVNGYMLSEKVGTELLAYDPIPGKYEGCVDLSVSDGKNWSLR